MNSLIKVYTVLPISFDTFNAIKKSLILVGPINRIKIAMLSYDANLSGFFFWIKVKLHAFSLVNLTRGP